MITTHLILFKFFGGASATSGVTLLDNIIFGQAYNMVHTIHENPMRPTDATTELTVRKRDKKPVIIGGEN